ncbi:MAG: PAS domain S-box protein [Burkholderiaceae bacterium]
MSAHPLLSGPDNLDGSAATAGGLALQAFLTRLIWLCMWPLLLLASYLAINDVRSAHAQQQARAAAIVRELALRVDQDLAARIAALQGLAASPRVDDPGRWRELYAQARGFRQGFGGEVLLVDSSGQLRLDTGNPDGPPRPADISPATPPRAAASPAPARPLAFGAEIARVIATARPSVGDVYRGPLDHEPRIAVAVPVLRSGRVVQVLIGSVDLAQFGRHLRLPELAAGWRLSLRDGAGTLIAAQGDVQGAKPNRAGAELEPASRSAPIGSSAWTATLETPAGEYLGSLARPAGLLALALLAAILVGLLGGTVAARRLGAAVRELARGGAQTAAPGGSADIAEIADVRQRLDEAAHQRDAATVTLGRSEQRFRRLFQESPLPMVLMSPAGGLLDLNASFRQVLGYGEQDLLTIDEWWQRAYPERAYREENRAHWQQALDEAKRSGAAIVPLERRIHCKDGSVRDMVVSGLRIDGEFLCILFDITERKRAEEAVRHGAALYRHSLDNMLEACQIIDFEWRYRYLNAAGAQFNRQPPEALLGRTMTEVHPEALNAAFHAAARRCMAQRISQQITTEFFFPDGRSSWLELKMQPVPEGIAIFSVDVTERRREDVAHQRLAAIIESSDDAIIGKTLDGLITSWNPGAEKLFGYAAAEALGQPMTMLMPPDRCAEEDLILARIREGRIVQHFETVRRRKDGTPVDVSVTISPIHDAQGVVIGASKIARDVTERRLAETRQAAQIERLSLLDQITSAIGARQDLDSIYQVLLRRLEDHLPVDFAGIVGLAPDRPGLGLLRVGAASATRAQDLGLAEPRPALELDPAGLAWCLQGELLYEPETADSRSPFAQTLAAGRLHALVMAPLAPLAAGKGGVPSMLVVAREAANSFSSGDCEFLRQLTAHVGLAAQQAQLNMELQAAYDELRLTQQAVMQQDRLRALGQMASGVAHDINNAISPVLLYTETLLEHEPDLSPRARSYLETIARSIDDVAATVARLREFYRQREPDLQLLHVPLAPLLGQVLELTRARWHDMPLQRGAVIAARLDLPDDLPEVMAIESELREALTNLIFNAADAMPDGGELVLGARLVPGPAHATPAQAAGCVEVWVRDTGIGMAEDTRRRCMEPFFTTKGERGTGLGLAMVYGVAQRHGAALLIESTPALGTTVCLQFPLSLPAEAAAPQPAAEPPLPALRVLLVDDDPLVLESLRETLEADGHSVRTADGGQAGIDAFAATLGGLPSAQARFDLVITDLGMPHVDGRQLARAVKQGAPATPVIMVTGWGQRLVADGELPEGVDRILSKPPKLRELRAAMAELTGRASAGERQGD